MNYQAEVEQFITLMSLAEKIGQMTQVEKNSITPEDVKNYAIGSVLSGGGGAPKTNTPLAWREMVNEFQQAALKSRLKIPLLYGVDAVHGHNNVIGATIFPHNIGLGATRDPKLVEQIARATAREILATGIHWNFAPCVAVPQDIRWGRTYEGYGADSGLVAELGAAFVRGTQQGEGGGLSHPQAALATVKHYLGDGGAGWGTAPRFGANWAPDLFGDPQRPHGIDQGITDCDEETLRAVHLPPYIAAIQAGVRAIMVSYSTWGGKKMHAQQYLLTEILKKELGFAGFLVSDWAAIDQINPQNYSESVITAINAGVDMVMVPWDFRRFITTLTDAVINGAVSQTRIDDAVRRILRVKLELDLFSRPMGEEAFLDSVGGATHRALARDAVRRSMVLIKNDGVLPITRETPLLVAGVAADDLGLQCGGWTIDWQGRRGCPTLGTTLVDALHQSRCNFHFHPQGDLPTDPNATALVVLAEPPYAEGVGDRADLRLPPADRELLERVRPRCRKLVVILYSGRPLSLGGQLPLMDALVAAWLPGTEGVGVTDVLFGDYPFSEVSPFPWPDQF